MDKIIVIHGEQRLRRDIDNYCSECSRRRSQWDYCNFKNQRACKKIQQDFAGRLRGELKEMYVFHSQFIKVEA
jgi:hypothetical protein